MEDLKMAKREMNNVSDIVKQAASVKPMSLFGASAMAFPDKISPVRSIMATRHTSQRVVLAEPEFPLLFTGAENAYGERSSWNITVDDDYELMKAFKKFPSYQNSTTCYILRNIHTGKYKCVMVYPAVNLTEKYGFKMNNYMDKYSIGDVLHNGTPIAQSSSYVNNNYCGGVNIRSAYCVRPELTEDALIISDYVQEALRYNMVDIIKVDIKKDSFLLNKYGVGGEYKPFPDVGEEIQNDIVCSIRENSFVSSFAEASMPHINDRNIYSKGTVVDIDIFTNVDEENAQVNKYLSQIRDWYSQIYSYISQIIQDPTQDDTTLLDVYHQADKWLNDSTWVTKEKIINTCIRFTVLQPKKIHVGQKVVGRYGNKSVVSEIRPRELMPRTDDGRPIDMLMNGLSIPNRIIAFATYENTINFQKERMFEYIKTLPKKGKTEQEIVEFVAEFIGIYNPNQGREILRLYNKEPHKTYNDIMKNGLYVQIEPLNEVPARDSIIEVYKRWPDIMKRYTIYDKLRHRWVPNDEYHAVGYQYTWVLKQEPSKAMSVVATGRTTYYDIPVKTRQYKNNLRRYSDNPIKFGEYDTYNFLAGIGPMDFAKITTYYRGSQYAENSMLMAQLNDNQLDLTKFNKFPQLSNMRNVLKLNGVQLKESPFTFNSIGLIDKMYEVRMNNVTVKISIPDLSYILQIHSYYLKYEAYLNGAVDLIDFFKHIRETNLFYERDEEYITHIFDLFTQLLPVLQQIKQYQ